MSLPSPPQYRPVVAASGNTGSFSQHPRIVPVFKSPAPYHSPPPALRIYSEEGVPPAPSSAVRQLMLSPAGVPRAPLSRPMLQPAATPSRTVFVGPPHEDTTQERVSARPQMQYVAPPLNLRSQVREAPNFPFRECEFVEALFELESCTVPYTWYLQMSASNVNVKNELDQAIRGELLGLLSRRVPLLLRDLWIDVVPGVATSLKFDFSQVKPTVVSSHWPWRIYIAVRSSSTVPCSLLVHALEDLVASRPTLTSPMEILERIHHRSVGSGELTLVDLDSYCTHVDKTESASNAA